ncbi:MAG: hypothetical protein ABIQ02_06740 [Saprospiraceae bacterium]
MACLLMNNIRFVSGMIMALLALCHSPLVYGQQEASWVFFSLGEAPLNIQLPAEPEPMETQIQPSMLQIIQAYYAYEYESPKNDVLVMLVAISYAQQIHPGLPIISDQAVLEMESRGALNVKYKTSSLDIEGKKGVRQKGTLEMKGDKMDFTTTILEEGTNVWNVTIYSKCGDAAAKKTGESILNSMTFNPK